MHFVFMASGIKHELDQVEKYLETMPCKLPFKTADGKEGSSIIQAALRPIRLYQYVFPRDDLNIILNTLNVETNLKSANWSMPNSYLAMLRKAMKLKKIPEPDKTAGQFPFPKPCNVRFLGIGIKEDQDLTFPNGMTYEGL